jgi:hypothetical protein
VLSTLFGPKWEEVTGDWRRLHNEELHNLTSSRNIIMVIKSRRLRGAWHVAHMVEFINTCNVLHRKHEEKTQA